MSIKYEKDELKISVSWLLDQLSEESKLELVERLACEESVIAHVASQIATGYTENCSSGSRGCGAEIEPHTALDKARRQLAMSANDVAKNELQAALNSLIHQKAWHDHYRDWAFSMYHAWGKQNICPERDAPKSDTFCRYEVIEKTETKET